jgi:hypothetical protein
MSNHQTSGRLISRPATKASQGGSAGQSGRLNRIPRSRRVTLIDRPPQLGAETDPVQIVGVRRLRAAGAQTEIEVGLGVKAETTTTFRNWALVFKVTYADGASSQVRESFSTPLPDKLVLRVPSLSPRDAASPLIGYEAMLKVKLQTVVVHTQTREFAAAGPPQPPSRQAMTPSGEELWVEIYDAHCGVGSIHWQEPVEVSWAAVTRQGVTIQRFDVEVETRYEDGALRLANRSVFGHERQAKFGVPSSGASMTAIKVGLKTTYSRVGSASAFRQGGFTA